MLSLKSASHLPQFQNSPKSLQVEKSTIPACICGIKCSLPAADLHPHHRCSGCNEMIHSICGIYDETKQIHNNMWCFTCYGGLKLPAKQTAASSTSPEALSDLCDEIYKTDWNNSQQTNSLLQKVQMTHPSRKKMTLAVIPRICMKLSPSCITMVGF